MNDRSIPWVELDDALIADFSPAELRAMVGAIELENSFALLAHYARVTTMRAWAIGSGQ